MIQYRGLHENVLKIKHTNLKLNAKLWPFEPVLKGKNLNVDEAYCLLLAHILKVKDSECSSDNQMIIETMKQYVKNNNLGLTVDIDKLLNKETYEKISGDIRFYLQGIADNDIWGLHINLQKVFDIHRSNLVLDSIPREYYEPLYNEQDFE